MKKFTILLTVLLAVVLLTGCGNTKGESKKIKLFDTKKTMTCVKEEVDSDGYKTSSNYKITYTSKKVTNVDSEQVMEMDPSIIDFVYSFGYSLVNTLNDLDGISASYEKEGDNAIRMKLSAELGKINQEQVKQVLGALNDGEIDNFYTKTDVTIDEFVKENLEGYTCK